ncbi:hypothetical protein LEMLEM_LOCUS17079 [Lemmus lemmus]
MKALSYMKGAARLRFERLQAMGEAGTMGRCRPFLGALWRRWWRRQQQQLRQRQQCWGPGRSKCKDAGCIVMGLTGLQKNVFKGQSKIYANMIPKKCFRICYPLQQENEFAHHEDKCQGKPLCGILRKP